MYRSHVTLALTIKLTASASATRLRRMRAHKLRGSPPSCRRSRVRIAWVRNSCMRIPLSLYTSKLMLKFSARLCLSDRLCEQLGAGHGRVSYTARRVSHPRRDRSSGLYRVRIGGMALRASLRLYAAEAVIDAPFDPQLLPGSNRATAPDAASVHPRPARSSCL